MVGTSANPTETDVIQRILSEVATQEGRDVLDLPPLGERIDTDALLALVESPEFVEASFSYSGYEVTVSAGQTVTVTPLEETDGLRLLNETSR